MTTTEAAERTKYPIGTTLDRVCASCDQPYVWVSEPDRQQATIYCSKRCRRRKTPERRVKRIALSEERPETAESLALLICAGCWTPFGWAPHTETSDDNPPLYHSTSCRNRAKLERRKARRTDRKSTVQQKRESDDHAQHVAAASAAARELLLPASHCATCGKVTNPTEAAAKEAKRAIEQRAGRTNEVRYYQCADGWWHWTRMDASLDGFRARQ